MRSAFLTLSFVATSVFATPAMAQDTWDGPETDPYAVEESGLAGLTEQLRDPAKQREIGLMMQTMTEVLLDLPLAPLAEAAAEIAGEDPASIDPHMTLRTVSPRSSEIPEKIGENVPRAMGAMAGLAKGLEAMLPALRNMADRVEDMRLEN